VEIAQLLSVLKRLFLAKFCISRGSLGFDDCRRVTIQEKSVVGETAVPLSIRGVWIRCLICTQMDFQFLDDLGMILDVPTGQGQSSVDQLYTSLSFRKIHFYIECASL